MAALIDAKRAGMDGCPKMNFGFSEKYLWNPGVGKQTCLPCVDWLFTSVLTVCLLIVYQCEYLTFTERKTSRLKNVF